MLPDLLETICTQISEKLPELRECVPHEGTFDEKEAQRFAARAPGVRVSIQGVQPVPQAQEHELIMAAFVITDDRKGLPRWRSALNIVHALLPLIEHNNWGRDEIGEARRVAAKNHYNSKVGARGISLWGIYWAQPIKYLPQDASLTGPLLKHLYLGMAPEIGIGHEPDYSEMAGQDTMSSSSEAVGQE